MTNNRIDDAELDALLSGEPRKVNRLLLVGIREIGDGLDDVKAEVKAMREVCETRGLLCPGMHGCVADPVVPLPPAAADDRRTWVMWAVSTNVLKMVGASGIGAGVVVLLNYIFLRHP